MKNKSPPSKNKTKCRYVIQKVFEFEKRKNIFEKTYQHLYFQEASSSLKKYKDLEKIPIPKNLFKVSNFFSFGDDWEYKSIMGWALAGSNVTKGLYNKRRKLWIRVLVEKNNSGVNHGSTNGTKVGGSENFLFFGRGKEEKEKLRGFYDKEFEYYETVKKKKIVPKVLILGGSGSGKSSLINACFGKTLAEIGCGKPVTQSYTKYGEDDDENSTVVIYDSKGIEHGDGKSEEFINDTKKFFMEINSKRNLENHIHAAWYVIDLTQTRFQPFEAEFCRLYLSAYPIIFIFNKADAVEEEVLQTMIKAVQSFNLPSSIGVIKTVADRKNFDVKKCPNCGTDKIKKRLKENECTILCKECKKKSLLSKTENIEELKQLTLKNMPTMISQAYIDSACMEIISKEEEVKAIILEACKSIILKTKKEHILFSMKDLVCKILKKYTQVEYLENLILLHVENLIKNFYGIHTNIHLGIISLNKTRSRSIGKAFSIIAGIFTVNVCYTFKKNLARKIVEEDLDSDTESLFEEKLIMSSFVNMKDSLDIHLVGKVEKILQEFDEFSYLSKIKMEGNFDYLPPKIQKEEEEEEFEILTKYQSEPEKKEEVTEIFEKKE